MNTCCGFMNDANVVWLLRNLPLWASMREFCGRVFSVLPGGRWSLSWIWLILLPPFYLPSVVIGIHGEPSLASLWGVGRAVPLWIRIWCSPHWETFRGMGFLTQGYGVCLPHPSRAPSWGVGRLRGQGAWAGGQCLALPGGPSSQCTGATLPGSIWGGGWAPLRGRPTGCGCCPALRWLLGWGWHCPSAACSGLCLSSHPPALEAHFRPSGRCLDLQLEFCFSFYVTFSWQNFKAIRNRETSAASPQAPISQLQQLSAFYCSCLISPSTPLFVFSSGMF